MFHQNCVTVVHQLCRLPTTAAGYRRTKSSPEWNEFKVKTQLLLHRKQTKLKISPTIISSFSCSLMMWIWKTDPKPGMWVREFLITFRAYRPSSEPTRTICSTAQNHSQKQNRYYSSEHGEISNKSNVWQTLAVSPEHLLCAPCPSIN